MERRDFTRASVVGVGSLLAGCSSLTSDDSEEIQDSDSDGVIDSQDYAPKDSSVQERSDLATTTVAPVTETATDAETVADSQAETETSTETPTATPTATPTETPTATPTETPTEAESVGTNSIAAEYEPIADYTASYFRSYSLEGAEIAFRPSELDDELQDRMRVVVAAQEYPDGDTLAYDLSDPFYVGDGLVEVSITYDLTDLEPDTDAFYLNAFLTDPQNDRQTAIEDGPLIFLNTTDRLSLDGTTLERDPHPDAKTTLETDSYRRYAGEGTYAIGVSGDVDFNVIVYKHAYISTRQRSLVTAVQTIRNAYEDGIAQTLSSIVYDAATEAGASTGRARADYALDAVQAFPYISDDVTDGYDNYNKYPAETLVEAGGDCEDSTILLASILVSEPYGLGTALLYLPPEKSEHIAVGVRGDSSVRGTYYTYDGIDYFYTETTGQGWEIGELPSEYDDMRARVVPV